MPLPGEYRYQPSTDAWHLYESGTLGPPLTIEEASGGLLSIEGDLLYRAGTRQILTLLGRTGDRSVLWTPRGELFVQSGIRVNTLNASSTSQTLRGVSTTTFESDKPISIQLPNGAIRTLSIPFSHVAGYGERLYAYTGESGRTYFENQRPGTPEYAGMEEAAGGSLRLATGSEAAEYAVRGYVRRNLKQLMSDYMEAEKEQTGDDISESEAVEALAELILEQLNYYSLYRYEG